MKRTWINWGLGIGLLLGISQLVLGWSMVRVLQRSEHEVARLIEEQVTCLNRIQSLTRSTGNVHRSVLNLIMADSGEDKIWAQERLRLSSQEVEKNWESWDGSRLDSVKVKVFDAWKEYQLAVYQIKEAIDKKDLSSARILRLEVLRPRFESLQLANSEWADATENEARNRADQIKNDFSQTRYLLTGLALGPLVIGTLICAAVLLMFSWMLFRLPDESKILPKD
jgi:hypothetical protein